MAHPTSRLLDSALRDQFAPVLRSDGFVGSGRSFRRQDGELLRIVSVQGSKYGGQFTVNLGVHLLFLPDVVGHPVDPKRITEPSCEFRRRMAAEGADQWWEYDPTERSINRAVERMVLTYESHGRKQLAHFTSYPDSFAHVEPGALESAYAQYFGGFGSTLVRMALAFARIRAHESNHEAAKAFAEIGLQHLGMATGLRSAFLRFTDLPAYLCAE